MKPTVLVTGPVPQAWLSDLMPQTEVTIWPGKEAFLMSRDQLLSQIGGFDAVLNFTKVQANAEFVERAARLKTIANGAGWFRS